MPPEDASSEFRLRSFLGSIGVAQRDGVHPQSGETFRDIRPQMARPFGSLEPAFAPDPFLRTQLECGDAGSDRDKARPFVRGSRRTRPSCVPIRHRDVKTNLRPVSNEIHHSRQNRVMKPADLSREFRLPQFPSRPRWSIFLFL
jgi:hypothetical protein